MDDAKLIISQNEQLKAQNKALQKELRDLQKRYNYLKEQHEVRLNEYDELLHKTPEHIPDCQNCENDILLRNSELEIEKDRLQWYYDKLNKALDIKEELNRELRKENEELKNKLRILKNDR